MKLKRFHVMYTMLRKRYKPVRIYRFPDGLTVRELKAAIKGWPEEQEDGTPTEVWIGTREGTSNQVKAIWPLDKRGQVADVILNP